MPKFAYGRAAEAAKMVCKEPKILLFVLLTDIFSIVHTEALRTIVCRSAPANRCPQLPLYRRHFSPMSGGSTGRDRTPTHGYEATREVAMAAFAKAGGGLKQPYQ